MTWAEHKLSETFGVEVAGISLRGGLAEDERARLYDLALAEGLVVIRGQRLTDSEMAAFARSLGVSDLLFPVNRLSNIDEEGRFIPESEPLMVGRIANMLWHIDSTYMRPRATISMLYGVTVPTSGGDTEFCDLRRAWERLSPDEQRHLRTLTATHSIAHSRALTGLAELPAQFAGVAGAVDRPLVEQHPDTGRTALLVASHIMGLTGYDKAATVKLVAELVERAATPDNVYVHKWRDGDFLMWDNRSIMHRGTPYAASADVRDLRTTRLTDVSDVAPGPR